MNFTIGSLFSGIGGLELGLEWAGLGPTLWQVEQDPKLRNCLATHWPEATIHEDVRHVGRSTLAPVDLICGGFPCQDVSAAGKRAGLDGARSGLWSEFARVVEEMRPRWVVVENVASGALRWVDAIRRDLDKRGYMSLPIPIAAGHVGAPHARARIFVVGALADCDDSDMRTRSELGWRGAPRQSAAHTDRKQLRQQPGRCEPGRPEETTSALAVADPESEQVGLAGLTRQHLTLGDAPDLDAGWQLQPSRSLANLGRWPCDSHRIWTAEPDVARVVYGLPGRVDRERALGNSVVPQCAEVVGWVIRELAEAAEVAGDGVR